MSSPVDPPVLRCVGIAQAYPAAGRLFGVSPLVSVLTDCSLEVASGRCVALVGQSGSGKSTLTRILLGLERPVAGHVFLGGNDALRMTALERARWTAPVFQNPAGSLNPAFSVRQILRRPLQIHRYGSAAECEARIDAVVASIGVDRDWLDERPAALSGGQQQRVAIARALLLKPRLLVLDEPTASLDVSVQAMILGLLDSLRRKDRLAMLFITHNLPVVAAIADEVLVLHEGRIVERGATRSVLSRPKHEQTRQLLSWHDTDARRHQP